MGEWTKSSEQGEYCDSAYHSIKRWWTSIALEEAYELVGDRKWPVLIPSYNNPNPRVVTKLLNGMTDNCYHEIIIFVRESQVEEYKKANKNDYVKIQGFKDELIDSAGKARKESLKWLYENGYDHAFSFDDDALGLGVTERGYTAKGEPKSKAIKNTKISQVLALWQLAMENLEERYPNKVVLTAPYPIGFSWKSDYCCLNESALLYRGNLNQVVCINTKNLVENNIIYKDNRECGHEDIQLILEAMEKDMVVATFPFIWYSTPPMDIANFSEFGSTMEERFEKQQELMKKNWEDCEYVTFKDKRGLKQVVINFRKYRKIKGIDDYKINIFNDNIWW